MSYIVSLHFVFDIRSSKMQKEKSHVFANAIIGIRSN